MDDLFLKIIDREIPANIIYEDEIALAFEDITEGPQRPKMDSWVFFFFIYFI